MCTFILAWQVFADVPVAVAANRDELLDRPSTPPAVVDRSPRVVAPTDDVAGGTWIGYNEHGLLVAVTNRWTDAALTGERSRGLLVREALARETAREAAAFVDDQVRRAEYDGFNLVVVDADDALLLEWDGELTVTEFDPGVHVVVNVGADESFEIPEFDAASERGREWRRTAEAQAENARRARAVLRPRESESAEEWTDRAIEVLRDHDFGFCVHQSGFGTRSSSLIRLVDDGEAVFDFADGPPCDSDVEFERVDVAG